MKGFIEDEEFGKIFVELRRGMTSVRFTYQADGNLLLRAPLGVTVSDLRQMVDANRERLRTLPRPETVTFRFGQVIECFRCRVMIERHTRMPGYILNHWDGDTLHLQLHVGGGVRHVEAQLTTAQSQLAGVVDGDVVEPRQ